MVVALDSPTWTRDSEAIPRKQRLLMPAPGSADSYPEAEPRLQHGSQPPTASSFLHSDSDDEGQELGGKPSINRWELQRPRGGDKAVGTRSAQQETAGQGRPPTVTQSMDRPLQLARAASHTVSGRPREGCVGTWSAGAPKKTLSG